MSRTRGGVFALALALTVACGPKRTPPPDADAAARDPASGGTTSAPATDAREVVLDALGRSGECSFGHDGVVVDLGDSVGRDVVFREATTPFERDGATWARIHTRTLQARVVLPPREPRGSADAGASAEVDVDAKIRSLGARSASVYLSGRSVGTWSLAKNETIVVSARSTALPPIEGAVDLLVRFNGVPKGGTDPIAEIDWIRIGARPLPPAYAPATRSDVVVSQTVAGVTLRAASLVAPGYARCVGVLPKGAVVEFSAAVAGKGATEVVVRATTDGRAAREIGRVRASDGAWTPTRVQIPDDLTGAVGSVEVEAQQGPRASRVLLGDLRVTAPATARAVARPAARNVVVVALGHTPRSRLALFGGPLTLPNVESLAARGTTFERHRATSAWGPASFASALTGRLPTEHCVEDDAVRLSADAITLGRAARDAGLQTALFSGNPTAGVAHGFDRDFGTFVARLPPLDPAARVFDDAATWLQAHARERFLLVIHARGGHPPWEVGADDGKSLAPEGYTGAIDGRHAAEVLAKARRIPPTVRFSDADRARAWALFDLAMRTQDDALGRVLSTLKATGHEADTAFVLTGDVGVSATAHVPFGDELALDESALEIPLVVVPSDGPSPPRASLQTSPIDVARTALALVGLAPPQSFGGVDLSKTSLDGSAPRLSVASAPRGRVAIRLGDLSLHGTTERAILCDVASDPACATDAAVRAPLADVMLRAELARLAARPACRAGSATPDPTLAPSLRAWGR